MDKGLEALVYLRERGLEFESSGGVLNVGIDDNKYMVYQSRRIDFCTFVLGGVWIVETLDEVGMKYSWKDIEVKIFRNNLGPRENYEFYSVDYEKYRERIK